MAVRLAKVTTDAAVPMVIGGKGRHRTPELAVSYAVRARPGVARLIENVGLVAGAAGRDLSPSH